MGKGVLALLLVLSVASWYLIVTKAIANMAARKGADEFLKQFWKASSLQEMQATLDAGSDDNAFSELARQALTVSSGNQVGYLSRAGADRYERPGHAGQSGGPRGRGADHDGGRVGSGDTGGAGLQLVYPPQPDLAGATG